MVCCLPIPFYGFFIIYFYTTAVTVATSQMKHCPLLILFRCLVIPKYRLFCIFLYAKTIIIAEANVILCNSHSLLCCFLIPLCRFCFVFCHPLTIVIAVTKMPLSCCMSLLCRFAIPFNCFFIVFIYTHSIIITITQLILSLCISLFCRFPIPLYRFFLVNLYTFTGIIAVGKCALRLRIPLHCRLAVQFCGLCLVLADAVAGLIAHTQLILCFRAFLLCRFGVPLYSRLIVREFHIQPPGHILRCCISLSCRRFVPSAGLFVVLFNSPSLIIALAQCALCLGIALLCGLFVPHDRIFFVFFHTSAVLIAPGHFKLCLRESVISGRDHVLLERHFRIACLLIILGIMQVVLLGFLFRLLLRFLAQTEAFHTSHKLLLFIFRANKQEAVHSIVLIAGIHLLDFSTQTTPLHAAHSRFKPLLDRFCLDGLRDFHFLSTHTDGFQLIRKTHFYLNFTHILSLLMVL